MRIVLIVAALVAIAFGILFMGQGSGLILWPASSFMLQQRTWIVWGGLIAVIGIIVLVVAARKR